MNIEEKLKNCKLLKAEALLLRKQYIDDLQLIDKLKKNNHPAYKKVKDGCDCLYERIEQLVNEYKAIENIIGKVPGSKGDFLRLYYIEGKSLEMISKEINYSKSSFPKLKREGIKWIEEHNAEQRHSTALKCR